MKGRALALVVVLVAAVTGCNKHPADAAKVEEAKQAVAAGKPCEASATCEAPKPLPGSIPSKCGCALLFDDECRAIIDSAYGRSAADNLKSRLDTDRAYGDPVQKQCPSPAAAAKPAMQTDAYAPSTAEPAKPVSEWWPAAEPAKPSSAPKTE